MVGEKGQKKNSSILKYYVSTSKTACCCCHLLHRLRRLNGLMSEGGRDRVDLYWEPKGEV